MKLLLTNDELHEVRGGTQVFISDLAVALQERGHTVAVYAWLRGSVSAALDARGVPVVESPAACGFVPEVIHGQHHLATMTALCAFPTTPAIYYCHGYGPWQERPPRHPRILKYVGMAEAMRLWLAIETGRPAGEIGIFSNSVHLGRFHKVRELCQRPRRALLYGNAFIPASHVSRLQQTCDRAGIRLDKLGAPFGNAVTAPEEVLPEYDLVFAIGRSALEAMACGCAVMPCSVRGCGPLIEPNSLEFLEPSKLHRSRRHLPHGGEARGERDPALRPRHRRRGDATGESPAQLRWHLRATRGALCRSPCHVVYDTHQGSLQ